MDHSTFNSNQTRGQQNEFSQKSVSLARGHDDLGQITTTTPSATFEGVGDLGQIGTIKETERLVPAGVSVILSGIDTDLLDEARNQDYVDRTAIIYIRMRSHGCDGV